LTALTRIPPGPNSAAHALVSRTSAALLAPYSDVPGMPNSAAIVPTLTIAPLPRRAIAGASSPTSTNGTLTLIANTASIASPAMDAVGPMGKIAALWTRMSTCPSPSSVARRASSRAESELPRSTAMKPAFAPLARGDVTTASPRTALRPPTST
jgi:hypothetical protein